MFLSRSTYLRNSYDLATLISLRTAQLADIGRQSPRNTVECVSKIDILAARVLVDVDADVEFSRAHLLRCGREPCVAIVADCPNLATEFGLRARLVTHTV